jgi:hypothetical protein
MLESLAAFNVVTQAFIATTATTSSRRLEHYPFCSFGRLRGD